MDPHQEDTPADYETCGTCGYDHEYDIVSQTAVDAMRKAHEKDEE